jgi:phytol kinase
LFVLLSWLLMGLPLLGDLSRLTIDAALIGLISTGLSAIAYYVSQPYLRRFSTDAIAWWCRAIITTLASSLVLLPLRHFL